MKTIFSLNMEEAMVKTTLDISFNFKNGFLFAIAEIQEIGIKPCHSGKKKPIHKKRFDFFSSCTSSFI